MMFQTRNLLIGIFLSLFLFGSVTWAQQAEEDLSAPVASAQFGETAASPTAIGDSLATDYVYLPFVTKPNELSGETVDVSNKASVIAFYNAQYLASATSDSEIGWTGSVGGCQVGTTSAAYRAKVLQRINFFRAMAGVPSNVILNDESNSKAQAAALMMSAEGSLSHSPGIGWACYTADGASGAGSSNLYLGRNGGRCHHWLYSRSRIRQRRGWPSPLDFISPNIRDGDW